MKSVLLIAASFLFLLIGRVQALEKYVIEGTPKTPSISFSPDGVLEIKGRSIPENSIEFYAPAEKWLEAYARQPARRTHVMASFRVVSKDSKKSVLGIIRRVAAIDESGLTAAAVFWEYPNDEILRLGQEIASEVNLPFRFSRVGETPEYFLRVAVMGGCPSNDTVAAVAAALKTEEKERGITINTSHVEYRTVTCGERADFVDDAFNANPYDAAVLIGDGVDPREVLESAALARVLAVRRAIVLLTGGAQDPAILEEIAKGLAALGFSSDASLIVSGDLTGAICPDHPAIASIADYLAKLSPVMPDTKAPFLMAIAETSDTTAYGKIETGSARVGDAVEIVGFSETKLKSVITGVEMFRKILDYGEAGDNVGLILRGIDKKDIRRGMVIAKPGSITPHSKFKAEVYVLKKEEGGRHTPFHNKYRPQFHFRTTDVTGEIELESGREFVSAGSGALIVPIAMDKGLRFAIREGGRTVGAGQVIEIIK